MATVKCPSCSNQVSPKASACPQCGHPFKTEVKAEKKSIGKKLLLGCFGTLGFLVVVGIVVTALNEGSGGRNSSGPSATVKPIGVSAHSLAKAYKDNEVSADMKFKGKWVVVGGRIGSIGKGMLGNMYVTLKSSNSQYQIMNYIQCFFADSHKQQLASLRKNQAVYLMGKVDGKMGNILVSKCRVVRGAQ